MAKTGSSTKGMLARRRHELSLYQQVLPSLELKRQQLLAERLREWRSLEAARAALDVFQHEAGSRFPMLARTEIAIAGLVRISRVEMIETRIMGTPLPSLVEVHWSPVDYSLLATPQWLDGAVHMIRRIVRQRLEIACAEERTRLLDHAIRKVVQKISLFEKVLVPAAKIEIQRIRVALADAERAAVVRSKIFKLRHERLAEERP